MERICPWPRIQELDDLYQAAAQMNQSRDQEPAVLRRAIAKVANDETGTDCERSTVSL